MYLKYYGLTEEPFSITADSSLFFQSKNHQEALSTVTYGIQQKKGLILLTGEVGTGKTTLCKVLLKKISPEYKTSLILNPFFSPTQLLKAVLQDFGLELKRFSKLDMISALNTFLINTANAGSNAVLIIDESQNLSASQLEQVRLLSNLETEKHKLLQIVLVGQPELREKLQLSCLRQIKQRIAINYHIQPLRKNEVKEYVEFRLKTSGAENIKFSSDTYQSIYEFSGGIPRLINIICDRALLAGFSQDITTIGFDLVKLCIQEINTNRV